MKNWFKNHSQLLNVNTATPPKPVDQKSVQRWPFFKRITPVFGKAGIILFQTQQFFLHKVFVTFYFLKNIYKYCKLIWQIFIHKCMHYYNKVIIVLQTELCIPYLLD